MSRMGFSEEAIVSQVNRSLGTYDTSAGGLAALKNAGVGDKVVTAMLNKGTAPEPPAGSAGANVAGPGTQTNQQALSNDSVIKMSAMGFSDDVIARQVNHSPGSYETSPAALTALRNAGVGDKAISADGTKSDGAGPTIRPGANDSRSRAGGAHTGADGLLFGGRPPRNSKYPSGHFHVSESRGAGGKSPTKS